MGLIKDEKLSCNYVLSKVSEAEIFTAYFGPFKFKQVYPSIFRKDRNPSTGFYISKTGKILYNDIARGEKLDCFAFVAKILGLDSYGSAIHRVAKDFGLLDGTRAKFKAEDLKKFVQNAEEATKETIIEIIPDKWTDSFLSFWKDHYITKEELVREDVYPVKKLFINGKLIPNYRKDIRYCYIIEINGDRKYKKIYTPHVAKKEFKWITNIPLYIPFGINKLPFKSNQLIITKSQKDRLIFQKYFTDVIATQNESPQTLNEKTISFIDNKYDNVVFNQDLDDAGIRSASHFVQYGYTPLFVPDIVKEKRGIKDFADFVKFYGLKKFEDFLKYKNLI